MVGLQVPVILFIEVVGKAGMVAPTQNGPTAANTGLMFSSMVMVSGGAGAEEVYAGVRVQRLRLRFDLGVGDWG